MPGQMKQMVIMVLIYPFMDWHLSICMPKRDRLSLYVRTFHRLEHLWYMTIPLNRMNYLQFIIIGKRMTLILIQYSILQQCLHRIISMCLIYRIVMSHRKRQRNHSHIIWERFRSMHIRIISLELGILSYRFRL